MSEAQGYLRGSKPSLRQRVWSGLGFGKTFDGDLFDWRTAEPGPSDWFVSGVISTHVRIHVGFLDRLRILISGECEVSCYTRTNVTVDQAQTRSDFAVMPPHK